MANAHTSGTGGQAFQVKGQGLQDTESQLSLVVKNIN